MTLINIIPLKVYAQQWQAVSSLQNSGFLFFSFTCAASMDKPLRWMREAPKHMEWEPTHSTGLSLELNLRLPCLCKFQVFLSVRRIEKEEEK